MENDENTMGEVVQYLNSLVTTINPGLDTPIPNRHSYQKRREEINDILDDYIELVNKLQRHTRCSPSYCLRVNRSGQQFCRFGFPKDNIDYTIVQDDGHRQPKLVTARNNQYINPHSRLQLQRCKAEPQSATFSEILNQVLQNNEIPQKFKINFGNMYNPDDPILASVQKLLLRSVAERDVSAQETCHLLLGIFFGSTENREYVRTGDIEQTVKLPLQRYWERPEELENYLLFKLNLTHKFTKTKWNNCKDENIEFCRVKVLLHVQHRNIEELTENGTIDLSVLYNRHHEEISANPADLLRFTIENEEGDDDDQGEEIEDDNEIEFQFDWMLLAEMGPNAVIDNSYDLGTRNIDRNHRWIDDARQRYLNTDLVDVDTFLQQVPRNNQMEDENLDIDYETLNEKQMVVFKRIKSHYRSVLASYEVEALKIIILGTAGTGKSYLIKAIRGLLRQMAGTESKSPILMLVPTGVAAFNISGMTIHSALSISVNDSNNLNLKGKRLKQLQERLEGVIYIIIDEKSMIGHQTLALIDVRPCQAFPEHKDRLFGDRSVIMVGDFVKIDSFTFDPEIPLVRFFRSPISSDIGESESLSDQTLEEEEEIIIYTPPEGMNQQQQGFDQFTAQLAATAKYSISCSEYSHSGQRDEFGEQDPITWIEEVERAFDANIIPPDQKIAVITPRLKSSATTWWTIRKSQNPRIDRWNDIGNLNQSFRPIFIQQFKTAALEAKWFTQLTQRKQLPGKDVDSYHNEMEEIIKRVEAGGHVYPDSTKAQIFVNGLRPEFCLHVSSLTPNNLQDAYNRAKAYENALKQNLTYAALLGFHAAGPAFNMNNSTSSLVPVPSCYPNNFPVASSNPVLINTIETAISKRESPRPVNNNNNNFNNRPRPVCYNCGNTGHIIRDCPRPRNRPFNHPNENDLPDNSIATPPNNIPLGSPVQTNTNAAQGSSPSDNNLDAARTIQTLLATIANQSRSHGSNIDQERDQDLKRQSSYFNLHECQSTPYYPADRGGPGSMAKKNPILTKARDKGKAREEPQPEYPQVIVEFQQSPDQSEAQTGDVNMEKIPEVAKPEKLKVTPKFRKASAPRRKSLEEKLPQIASLIPKYSIVADLQN
ncbi:hypothetical protein Glove_147g55 [Diversispora epigaea]|uniref:ATP-dependent DNA helicase n=1 Tax=Diversispora epigaea TaxID=1348612 RepID=A0A397J036_9GLOM|nr:hypothetical protein Glove_147g55 [Diversispora epigaea]